MKWWTYKEIFMYYVYILTDKLHRSFIVGGTNNVAASVKKQKEQYLEQQESLDKPRMTKLVYFREFPERNDAFEFAKEISDLERAERVALIETMNPDWDNLLPYFTGHIVIDD